MNGYSGHAYVWQNDAGEHVYVKYHFKIDQGIRTFTREEATEVGGQNPNFSQLDLFHAIERGEYPSWTWYVQIMTESQAREYGAKNKIDVFDMTKVWKHSDSPLIPVGKMVLNRNPENYFAEVKPYFLSVLLL